MSNDSEERLKRLEKMTSDHDIALWGDREDMEANPGAMNIMRAMQADVGEIKRCLWKIGYAFMLTCVSLSATAVCGVLWLGFKAAVKAP